MRLLDFALRQADRGYQPWTRAAVLRTVLIVLAISVACAVVLAFIAGWIDSPAPFD